MTASEALKKLLARETELVAEAPYGGGRLTLSDTSEWACELRSVRWAIKIATTQGAGRRDRGVARRDPAPDRPLRWDRPWSDVPQSDVDGWLAEIRRIKAEKGGG